MFLISKWYLARHENAKEIKEKPVGLLVLPILTLWMNAVDT
jgi:hypothetical protein